MDEFEEQIRLQQQAAAGKIQEEVRTRTDPDGTVFEFDPDKKAWFPKIDDDFLAKYQMNYGETTQTEAAPTDTSTIPPQPKDINSEEYRQWYYKYYSNTNQASSYDEYYKQYYQNYSAVDTSKMTEEEKKKYEEDRKNYEEYYKKYYGQDQVDTSKMSEEELKKYEEDKKKYEEYYKTYSQSTDVSNMSEEDRKKYEEYYKQYYGSVDTSNMSEEDKKKHEEYWKKYYENPKTASMSDKERKDYEKYWKEHAEPPEVTKLMEEEQKRKDEYMKSFKDFFKNEDEEESEEEEDNKKKKRNRKDEKDGDAKGKKRKVQEKKPLEWFDAGDDVKNPNVYVSGLPDDITDEEFEEMMKKFGLVMFDPFTKKPKCKLYKDKSGAVKGDGLCCYIKQESVQLCMDILDGSDLRGFKIYVERAKFERKGEFDPEKAKKKKLNNKQKKKLRERQERLFDWRADEVAGGRQRYERIIVVKNVFDPKVFERNPAAINDVRENLRAECSNHGEVKKVIIYDRHAEGIATVAFPEPEVADGVITAINNRIFYGRTILAFTWDGKTKYDVKETPEEEKKRLEDWAKFLEEEEEKKTEATAKSVQSVQNEGKTEGGPAQSDGKEGSTKSDSKEGLSQSDSKVAPSQSDTSEKTTEDTVQNDVPMEQEKENAQMEEANENSQKLSDSGHRNEKEESISDEVDMVCQE